MEQYARRLLAHFDQLALRSAAQRRSKCLVSSVASDRL
jgi:hypothetical protein